MEWILEKRGVCSRGYVVEQNQNMTADSFVTPPNPEERGGGGGGGSLDTDRSRRDERTKGPSRLPFHRNRKAQLRGLPANANAIPRP